MLSTPSTPAYPLKSLVFEATFEQLVEEVTGTVWEELFETVDVVLSKERVYPTIRSAVATALEYRLCREP
jgi:hypothetical protein